MADYEVFQSFFEEKDGLALRDLLLENGIDARLEKTRYTLGPFVTGDSNDASFHLKIRNTDFGKANGILNEYISKNLADVDADHYLHSFSDEELREIIQKPDEWSKQDYVIAKTLLQERGVSITEQEVQEARTTRMTELRTPDKIEGLPIILGYIAVFLFFPYAIFYGLLISTSKKVLPDGSKVYIYDEKTRSHGRTMFGISLAVLISFVFIFIL